MAEKRLGLTDIMLTQIGLGCMGLSEFYGPPTEESAAINLLHEAIDLGVNHFDTAQGYGVGRNETLLGKAFLIDAKKFASLRSLAFCATLIQAHR